jgi:hypothetical protein
MSIIIAAIVAATSANVPIYLKCTFPGNGAVLDLTADEPNLAVTTVLASTGYTEKYPAAFTPTELRFEGRQLGYVVNRVDLSIRRTIKLIDSTDAGKCALVTAPKRAF